MIAQVRAVPDGGHLDEYVSVFTNLRFVSRRRRVRYARRWIAWRVDDLTR